MKPEAPDIATLGATMSPGQPSLRRTVAIRAEIGEPTEFATTHGTTCAMFPIMGGTARGADWSARILPGGADFAKRLPDGSYLVEARYMLEIEDQTLVMVTNAGRMFEQPDGSFIGRTRASLEVPDGPHRDLGEAVFFGTALAEAHDLDTIYIELWEAVI